MKLLAIDTSTDYLTLAIMNGEKVISRFHRKSHRNHSRLLIPMIDRLLKKAGLRLKKIDGFCIGIGPGSFTGLRIGVATVKGLAYSLKKPIVAVPTLDAIAQNVKNYEGIICPILDAKKNKVYAAIYKSDGKIMKKISPYLLLPTEELKKRLASYDKIYFLGDAIDLMGMSFERSFWPASHLGRLAKRCSLFVAPAMSRSQDQTLLRKVWHPKAEVVARLGLENFKKKKFVKPEDLEPLYLYSRECDIKGI